VQVYHEIHPTTTQPNQLDLGAIEDDQSNKREPSSLLIKVGDFTFNAVNSILFAWSARHYPFRHTFFRVRLTELKSRATYVTLYFESQWELTRKCPNYNGRIQQIQLLRSESVSVRCYWCILLDHPIAASTHGSIPQQLNLLNAINVSPYIKTAS